MKYSDYLKKGIEEADLSLAQICRRVLAKGGGVNKSYLSKLQRGATPPARDKLNEVLAEVLGLDPLELKTAAYIEKLPPEVVERIKRMA
ncbi:helix-turn-helix transcriptional regulator [Paenibacillus sp. FSL K6-1330]|uniref:helix-turn-helix domain-containing protein n=1 Tax=Paenibacillus sp. FSL K6-1330 TaxID=2975292 RepID=UPI0030D6F0F6